MRSVWDILYARQPVINYVAPPVCEIIFSGSGQPVIVLSQNPVGKVTGLVLGGTGGFRLSWNIFPGAICYNIYFINGANVAMILAQCVSDPFYELPEGLGDGTIVVTPITPEGEGEPSDPIAYPSGGGGGCSQEPGDPSPSGPNAFCIPVDEMLDPIPIEREDLVFLPTLIDPMNPDIAYQEFVGDWPPGHYNLIYAGGFFDVPASLPVIEGVASVNSAGDDNNPLSSGNFLINGVFEVNPPFGGPFGSGQFFNGPDHDDIQAQAEAYFNTPGAELQWKNDNRHENNGGKIFATFNQNVTPFPLTSPMDFEFVITLVQIDGLIQQPRKIRIQAWNIIKLNFPAAIRDNWDGTFPTRPTYTETSVVWTAAASGPFTGATLFYTQAHPTAPNGCGWVVHIGGLYWTGYKKVGDQPTGIYNQSGVLAPGCVTLEAYE